MFSNYFGGGQAKEKTLDRLRSEEVQIELSSNNRNYESQVDEDEDLTEANA